jgi:nucleotide-binding universal stress UspA family protein
LYKHILAATDGSLLATRAVEHAAMLATTLGATLTVVTVTGQALTFDSAELGWSVPGNVYQQIREANDAKSRDILGTAKALAAERGVTAATVHVEDRRPYEGILSVAGEVGADLIVMASNGHRGLERLILGSQATKVLTLAKIPVLIVK